MKPLPLTARITSLLVVTSLLVLGGGARFMDWRIDHDLELRFRQNLLTQAIALGSMMELEESGITTEAGQAISKGTLINDGQTYYDLRCEGHPPLQSRQRPPVAPATWPASTPEQPTFFDMRASGRHIGAVQLTLSIEPSREPEEPALRTGREKFAQCQLLFEQDRAAVDAMLIGVDWVLTLGPLLAIGIALIVVPVTVRRGLRPMAALVERMGDIGPNAPGQRLVVSGVRELDPLVSRFNDVLARMDEGLARERQFASGLAHETRTRLAELRALAEIELRYPSGRSREEVLTEVGHIGAELEATVTALLLLSRLQAGVDRPQYQWLSLGPWVEHQVQRHAGGRQHLVKLQHGTSGPLALRTDPALLEVVVGNLLTNACAYVPAGDLVRVTLHDSTLMVDNAAPELEPEDVAKLAERFWRKHPPSAGHAGLGLALARAAANALGVSLAFELNQGRLCASVSWPLDLVGGHSVGDPRKIEDWTRPGT